MTISIQHSKPNLSISVYHKTPTVQTKRPFPSLKYYSASVYGIIPLIHRIYYIYFYRTTDIIDRRSYELAFRDYTCKNEEKNIGDCIKSAKFADEILIIDDYSTDSTASIAKTLGARVVKHSLNNSWESQKNFAISITTGEWIFFLDADERISSNLADEISKIVQNNTYICGIIRRYNQFRHYTATHGSVRPDKVLRLCPKRELM